MGKAAKLSSFGAGPLVVFLSIAAACIAATKDVPAIDPIPPRVLDAQLDKAARGDVLRVTAQDPDGTIVALNVRWSDGHVSEVKYPCRADDFGGKTITQDFTHRDAVAAGATQVRAVAASCFGAQPRHAGSWANAQAAG